ncbi:MAG: hypothetical protein IT186_16290, partial [Acidobacteria bacterium]|nr:hypothetical protein [Acidobacteriota bacterium]
MSRSVATYKNVLLAFIAAASLYRCPELQSQSIFTVAGGGIDDGGPALGAALHPEAVAQDAAGNLYIADKGHSRIRKVSAVTGLISTFAGNGFWGYSGDGGLATAAAVNQPSDVRFDRDGNLYVSDWANYRIRKIAAGTGVITTVAGGGSLLGDGGPATAAALHEPNSLDIDDAGNIYFVDRLNYRIRKIDKNTGIITTIAGNGTNSFAGDGGLAVAASLYLPDRLAVDPEGSIYFSEFRRVRKIDGRTGLITTFAGGGFGVGDGEPATATALGTPHGVAVGPDGDIFIGTEHDVRRVARNTGVISTVVTGGYFYGIRFGPSGKLYAATMENYVFEIDPVAKTKLKVAGGGSDLKGDGGPALRATLSQPSGMAADGGGNLYIADTNNGAVRRVDGQTGVISTLLRVNALSPARPYSVAVDVANGDIYAGSGYGIIRFDSKTLTASTIVDSADRCVLGDGGPASLATTRPASGLAVDTSGDLLLRGDQRVREISLRSGLISTVAGNGSSTFTGENGPATAAYLRGGVGGERGVALDTSGNIYVTADSAVRRVAAQTGRITTVAGTGKSNYCTPERGRREDPRQIIMSPTDLALDRSGDLLIATSRGIYRLLENENVAEVVAGGGSAYPGDGGPATSSDVTASGIALDAAGNLFLTDRYALRRVDTGTGIITTVAGKMGTMGFAGDGGPATAALFSSPSGIAVDRSGNVFVADSTNYRVRKIDAETGVIRTVAGNGTRGTTGDGGPATQAMLDYPTSVLVDSSGNLFIAAERVRRVAAATGVISTVPGTEGLSVSALAFDGASGLLVAGGGQVSRVSLYTGSVTTVAGTRAQGAWNQFEGSPAKSIPLGSNSGNDLLGVATDSSDNLYFPAQGRVLKASAGSRTITTVAGGKTGFSGDGGPANQAGLSSPMGVAIDSSGDLYVADSRNKRIRRVDARSGTISTFAGGGTGVGDGGRATDAELGKPVGVNVGPSGTVYIADAVSSLIRAVSPCQSSLGAFDGSYPGDGSLVSSGTLGINWARAESAFRYDVVLDTDFPPKVVVQRDVSGQGLQVAGLAPGKTYYWQVRAKGDPYCPAVERTSGVRRFTVPMPCLPPAAPV